MVARAVRSVPGGDVDRKSLLSASRAEHKLPSSGTALACPSETASLVGEATAALGNLGSLLPEGHTKRNIRSTGDSLFKQSQASHTYCGDFGRQTILSLG